MWENISVKDAVSVCPARNICDYFDKYLPVTEPILEAGCGLGAWLIYLKNKGYNIVGIDWDGKVIERLREYNKNLDVLQGDVCRLNISNNHLGAYISLGVVEHFQEGIDKPLAEAWRVLKPGGVIILTVPFNNLFRRLISNHLRFLYLMIHRLKGGKVYFGEYRYTEIEVCKMLTKAGFKVLQCDIDDFIDKTRSMGLWADFPFFRSKSRPYSLNFAGRIIAYIMNAISRKTIASGILAVAKKI